MSIASPETQMQAPIAIIGMGCLFPRAQSVKEYWRLIRRGEDAITEVPPTHWQRGDYFHPQPDAADMTYCTRGAFLSPIAFDPVEFGIPPNTLEATDTSQLLSLIAARDALIDAGYDSTTDFDRSRISVIMGVTGALELVIPLGARLGHPIWRRALQEAGVAQPIAEDVIQRIADGYVSWQEASFPGLLGNVVAGRIANRLNLKGANCAVDAACASSLSAIHLALLELQTHRADVVLSGGSDTFNDIFMFMCFSKTQALSATGDARPFAAGADGTVIGEGVGIVALKRLEDAERDGDRIYAVIRSVGASSDGRSQSIYAPLADGQAQALRNAYRLAGIDPATIELVEGHGTGTRVGDATEFEALRTVFGESGRSGSWCALGSVKSQIGHTKAAAGAAGLIKAALALHHKTLPTTIKADAPHSIIAAKSAPHYLNTQTRPWLAAKDHPRRAGVSAFGFGGSNFHAVLEEHAATPQEIAWDGSTQIIALSAHNSEALHEQLDDWRSFLSHDPDWSAIAHRALQSRQGFQAGEPSRLTLVISLDDDLDRMFAAAQEVVGGNASQHPGSSRNIFFDTSAERDSVAVLFPGQASQYVNMGRDLTCVFPQARAAIEEANDDFGQGERLGDLIFPQPAFDDDARARQTAKLTQTENAQPALGAVCLAAWRVLQQFGVRPNFAAGHSFGELVALRAAGCIDDAALRHLARLRGALMADGHGDRGAMMAIRAPLDEIESMLTSERIDAVLANRNSPTQGVISGPTTAIDRVETSCLARGWNATRLAVSAAFHTSIMDGAARRFAAALQNVKLSSPALTVFANSTSSAYPDEPDALRQVLAKQITSPVDFVAQIERMYQAGARVFVEVGPNAVLASLVGRILQERPHHAIALDASRGKSGLLDLARALAKLAALGAATRLAAWEPNCPEPRMPRMTVPLVGSNYRSKPKRRPELRALPAAPAPQQNDGISKVNNKPASAENDRPKASPTETATPQPTTPNGQPADLMRPLASHALAANNEAVGDVLAVVQEGLRAMQNLQQQTATAHQRFLEGQELAHKTFQLVLEGQQRLVDRIFGGAAPLPNESPASRDAAAPAAQPATPPVPMTATRSAGKNGDPIKPTDEIEAALLAAVHSVAGYPIEALHLDMHLLDDLNLDRLQLMDVFDHLAERVPAAQTLASDRTRRFETLREIADRLRAVGDSRHIGDDAEPRCVDGTDVPHVETETSTSASAADDDLQQTLLSVVAEVTGYPLEMLDADMDLEADLGIDSIKRVEILAAVQEKRPDVRAVDSSYIGSLRTLRNIIEFMQAGESDATATSVAPSDAKPPAATPPVTDMRPQAEASHLKRPKRQMLSSRQLLSAASATQLLIHPGGCVWITDDQAGVAQALAGRLEELGYRTRIVDLAHPSATSDGIDGLILIAPLTKGAASVGSADVQQRLKQMFSLARSCASSLQNRAGDSASMLVTVARMDGAFGLGSGSIDPCQGALAALAKTAAREWPDVHARAIDVDAAWTDTTAIVDAIMRELCSGEPLEVGLSSTGRCGLELCEQNAQEGDIDLNADDVVVISGGARGVTAEVACALADRCHSALALLGRSPAPMPEPEWLAGITGEAAMKKAIADHDCGNGHPASPREVENAYRKYVAAREIATTLGRIRACGAKAAYVSVDVRDADAVRTALDRVERDHGRVTAIVHGAGVIEDRRIEDKTDEQFSRVFDTKVKGLQNLIAAIDPAMLKYLILFSSVSARYGNPGQVDYAMANEVLNKFAQRWSRLHPDCRTVSINWGPWDGGMVGPALKQAFARQGVGLIPLEAGAAALLDELAQGAGAAVEVVIGDGLPGKAPQATRTVATTKASPGLAVAFDRRLDLERHPFLTSHVIGNRPVLPAAIMLEWLGHAALHENPGLLLHGFDEFRVLKGVVLDGDAQTIRGLASKASKHGDVYSVSVELHGEKNGSPAVYARAHAILGTSRPATPIAPVPTMATVEPYPVEGQAIYESILFHGPRLHGIHRVTGHGPDGITAIVAAGAPPADWMSAPLRSAWLCDPLLVDAAFQLGLLWCHVHADGMSLPHYCEQLRHYGRPDRSETITAHLCVRDLSAHLLKGDVTLADAQGRLVMTLTGARWTIDSSLRQAFQRDAAPAGA